MIATLKLRLYAFGLNIGMAGKSHSFFHSVYQVLFIIYAPVAIFTFLVKYLSNINIDYFYLTATFFTVVSLALGVVMSVLFVVHREKLRTDQEQHLPYILRRKFFSLYLPIVLISIVVMVAYIVDSYINAPRFKRITILTPIKNDVTGREYDHAGQVKAALGHYLVNSPNVTEEYHFTVIDHKNNLDQATRNKIIDQLNLGARYLVCTYSQFCATLADELNELVKDSKSGARPILVTTMASSMNLQLESHQYYRFYPRNRETANVLAREGMRAGLKTASFIATNDNFGQDAVKQFEMAWRDFGGEMVPGLYLDRDEEDRIALGRLRGSELERVPVDAVFVAHYSNMNETLKSLPDSVTFLFTPDYKLKHLASLKEEGVTSTRMLHAIPSYKAANAEFLNTQAMFVYLTLAKLVHVDQLAEGDTNLFRQFWFQDDFPGGLHYSLDGEWDFRIEMEAFPYGEDVHSSHEN